MQPEALECSEYCIAGSRYGSVGIEVIDSNNPLTLSESGLEKAGERRIERAEMQRTGWRRCKPTPITNDRVSVRMLYDCVIPGLPYRPIGLPEALYPICLSRISSSVLQSIHSVAVGRASSRRIPISTPHDSQYP
jgi:hypothetical protein